MPKDWRAPIHPGEHLADELEEMGINAVELARRIEVPPNRIYQILSGKRCVSADTALRLGKFFNTGPELWLNLQQKFDLETTRLREEKDLRRIKPFMARPASASRSRA